MDDLVLFLDGNSEKEFYNKKRNEYENVTATNIFKNNSILNKIFRKIIIKMKLPLLPMLFGDWKKEIKKYSTVILSTSIYSLHIANYIQKKTNSRIIHWYWNPVIKSINPKKIMGQNTELWSFDINDCKNYGMNYISTYYFSNIKLTKTKIKNDIYFMGADKGRLDKLLKLKETFEKSDLRVKMHITKSEESNHRSYSFMQRIPYQEVLEGISESIAILDLVQAGQSGMSQRPMEALFLEKKLITNDKNISKYEFYNKNNIFILGKDDINNIASFINSDYVQIDEQIIRKYDFGNWLNRISNRN
ncbi:hypothetical protein [Neobacillus sp. 114]|uniref:hypothetical protein n=1 Tax=Neobacillus sp. 114 TaxID=3048535 RepID=UPI0024C36A25|nr:hypothetical protein [Neobacillus sp. 114]